MRWLLLLVLGAGCTRLAEDRAQADLEVGTGAAGDVAFAVTDGLAHILAIDDGELRLWAQAPVLELTAEATGAGSWEIEIANAMPDALLTGTGGGGPLTIEPLPGPRPTVRRFRVDLPAATDIALRLAPPDAGVGEPWQVVVMGDIQTALPRVHEVFDAIEAVPGPRFVLSTGDLVESAARDEYELFFDKLAGFDLPYYTTLGNHETYGDEGLWRQYFGRHSFHFTFKGVDFSLLDSGNASIDPIAYDWLDDWLAEGLGRTHLFLTHYPPIDPIGVRAGAFRSRREASKLLALLAAGEVDLTLYGHIHSYYDFSNAGIPAYISGGGGAWPEAFDGIGRHFLVLEVAPDGVRSIEVVRVD
jgi:predicted phosphodiesterase